MTLQELLKSKEFQFDANLTITLYALAEKLGIPKEDIMIGAYDKQFKETKERIYKHLGKLLDQPE